MCLICQQMCLGLKTKQSAMGQTSYLEQINRKTVVVFFICKNKDADQLQSNCEADQCLCYTDSIILLLPKFGISSLLFQASSCTAWSAWDLIWDLADRFSRGKEQLWLCYSIRSCPESNVLLKVNSDPNLYNQNQSSALETKWASAWENQRFAYAKTKDADQLRGNREADQRLCFRLLG